MGYTISAIGIIVCIDGNVRGDDFRDAACHVSTGADNRMRDIANRCGKLSTAMGGLKSAITKFANANKIEFTWQSRFHDHIIRNQDEMNKITSYIENNPTTWMDDKFYTE